MCPLLSQHLLLYVPNLPNRKTLHMFYHWLDHAKDTQGSHEGQVEQERLYQGLPLCYCKYPKVICSLITDFVSSMF